MAPVATGSSTGASSSSTAAAQPADASHKKRCEYLVAAAALPLVRSELLLT